MVFVVPLALAYCLWEQEGKIKGVWAECKFLLSASVSWGAAYVMSYLVKWTLSGMVLSEERFSAALGQFFRRQGSDAVSFALDSLSDGKVPLQALEMSGGNVLP